MRSNLASLPKGLLLRLFALKRKNGPLLGPFLRVTFCACGGFLSLRSPCTYGETAPGMGGFEIKISAGETAVIPGYCRKSWMLKVRSWVRP